MELTETVAKYQNHNKWGWYRLQPGVWKRTLATSQKLRVLEIGAYDGVSANVMLDAIFTHPESEVHTIDPYLSDPTTPGVGAETRERFEENCRRGGHGNRILLYEGLSVEVLGWMIAGEGFWEGFDVVFIDGSHLARNVMTDATMSWHLLKPGGMLVFDDYQWGKNRPATDRPREAIDAFLAAYANELHVVWSGAQMLVQKRVGAGCPDG